MHQPRAPFEEPCAWLGLSELVYSHVKAHHHRLSVHSRVGSGLCHKKATRLLFFKCVICCCLRESVCVLKGRASERRRMFYIVFVKRAKNENMGKRDDERERISSGVPQILEVPM